MPVTVVEVEVERYEVRVNNEPVHIVTVPQQGPRGPAGPPGAGGNTLAMEFEWNNATTRTVGTIPGGCVVTAVLVGVVAAWAAAGSSAAVGVAGDPGRFFDGTQADLTAAGEYESHPAAEVGADIAVILSLVAGSGESSGRGFVVVEYQPLGA